MSNKAINWAKKQHIKAPAKPVLIVLANIADNVIFECWPSLKTIAFESGYSRSAVQEALIKLKTDGYLTWKQQFIEGGIGKTSNLYRLNVKVGSEKVKGGGRGERKGIAGRAQKGSPPGGNKPSIEPSNNPIGTSSDKKVQVGGRKGTIKKLR